MKKMRLLKSDEIEVRVADTAKNGDKHLLLYINSRAAGALLDECYGMENWNLEYHDVAGQPYGRLSIYDEETQRWVVREDTGEEAKISADKSLASDILKRLVVRFGVSELYSTPAIYVKDDGYGCNGYRVSEIAYDEGRNITHLVLVNRFGKETYRWDKGQKEARTATYSPKVTNTPSAPSNSPRTDDITALKAYCRDQYDFYQSKEMLAECAWTKEFAEWYIPKLQKGEWKGEWNTKRVLDAWIDRKRRTPSEIKKYNTVS